MPEGRSGRRHVLTITKGPQRGRSIHIGGGKRTYGALRKTTKKGAYKKGAKRNFQKRRAPFVETKSIDDLLVAGKAGVLLSEQSDDTIRNPVNPLEISNGTAQAPNTLTMLPIYSFFNMERGLSHSDIIGDNIYSRYLKCKVEFELPRGESMIKHPCDVYLVHGWVTLPLGLNFNTTPEMNDLTRTQLNQHIENQVKQYFNQRSDKLQYINKRTNNIKILGYRKLKPKQDHNLGANPTPQIFDRMGGTVVSGAGAPPPVNMSCNWPTKRKIFYTNGKSNLQQPVGNFGMMYPNYSWLPFMCVYNPTASEFFSTAYQGAQEPKIKVRYNSKHYWTDS